jgi:hypothetical protein
VRLLLLFAVLLTGCQTAPLKPTVVTGAVDEIKVNTVVVQPCVDPSKIQAVPPSAMPPRTADVDALADGAYADAIRYREIARKQNEQLIACSKLKTQ